jgi:hypothetical protein
MKICNEYSILNLKTNRCISTKNKLFLKLLKLQTEKNEKWFLEEDLVKLGYLVQSTKIPVRISNAIINHINLPILPILPILPSKVIEKLHTKADQVRKLGLHLKEDQKQFCEGKQVLLNNLLINESTTYNFTYTRTPLHGMFDYGKFEEVFDKTKFKVVLDKRTGPDEPITRFRNNHSRLQNEEKEHILDIEWFNELDHYMSNLEYTQLFAVHGYTRLGDVLVNNFLRGTFDYESFYFKVTETDAFSKVYFPLFFPALDFIKRNFKNIGDTLINGGKSQMEPGNLYISVLKQFIKYKALIHSDFKKSKKKIEMYNFVYKHMRYFTESSIKTIMQDYINTLQDIIKNAPPLKKKLTVYRGVIKDYYFPTDAQNIMYRNKGFVSTTINKGIATHFMKTSDCCFKIITLLPGTKVLWTGGASRYEKEDEFLLGLNTTYLIRSHETRLRPDKDYTLCEKNKDVDYITVSEVVAI